MNINSVMNAYKSQADVSRANDADFKANENGGTRSANNDLGKTVGEPKLSAEAQKYYNHLKKQFGQYDFVLVSADQKDNVRANAGKYANGLKTVVLIDEEKIERMATDKEFRKQYEGILSGASKQIEQIKAAVQNAGASLKGVVMQVNDNGTTSFFAAVQKTNDAQKERIEKRAVQKKAEKKAEQKKAQLKKERMRAEEIRNERKAEQTENTAEEGNDETVTFMADSLEGLLKKIEDFGFEERSNSVRTDSEKLVGQHIDFRM